MINSAGSQPAGNETSKVISTQAKTKETVMHKNHFKLNVKARQVVELVVSLSLVLGVVHSRSYATSI